MSFSYPGTFILRSIFWRAICWSAVGWRTSLPASLSRFEWGPRLAGRLALQATKQF